MLIIHIGSPKTGTTALQGFLKTHSDALGERGVHFVRSGRSNIAHNSMVRPLLKGKASDTLAAIRDEISSVPASVHVLSSEMFFRTGLALPLAEGLRNADTDIRIVGYLRRPDAYAEAMYKQRVKNGRIPRDPAAFLEAWGANLAYLPTVSEYRDAFGQDALRIRPFRRELFADGNVISDFASCLGDVDVTDLIDPNASANTTLSRAVSEHLGRVSKTTDFNTRVMIREIIAEGASGTRRSHDVFDKGTRSKIVQDCLADLNAVREICFSEIAEPFDMADLAEGAPDRYPDEREALELERIAADAVMEAVGRQSQRAAS